MSAASLFRFLEDFDRPAGSAVKPVPASMEFEPAFRPESVAAVQEPARKESIEELLAQAREEGAALARDEMTRRHRDEMQKLRAELESAALEARQAEIAALCGATKALFEQYDSWLDRMFETSLRPLIAGFARKSALDTFKSQLLEAVGRKGACVRLSGPQELVSQMVEMLRPHGIEIETGADESGELRATFDAQSLQTRFDRIEDLLATGHDAAAGDAS